MPDRGDFSALADGSLTYRNIVSRDYPDGKTYRVAEPDAATGLRWAALGEAAMNVFDGQPISEDEKKKLELDDDAERTLYQVALGPVHDEMVADGVPFSMLKNIACDAWVYWAVSPELANLVRDRLGEEMAAATVPSTPSKPRKQAAKEASPRRTSPSTGGSKSSGASGGTRARTRARTSTPSSTSTRKSTAAKQPPAQAKAV